MVIKKALCILSAAVFYAAVFIAVLMACATTAYAAERVEPSFTMDSAPESIAAEVLLDGDAYIDSCGTSLADKASVVKSVQSYVDSVTSLSQTPTVKGSVYNNGRNNERVKLVLIYADNNLTDEEVLVWQAKAGNTIASINSFLMSALSYEKNTEGLTMASAPATAKGALNSGKAICMGYSNAFSILAERAGIKSVKVRGYVNGGYHVMNVVEGGFVVDVTWNDSSNNRYFMIPLDEYCASTGFQPEINFSAAFALKYNELPA